jgi:hypothetical protein
LFTLREQFQAAFERWHSEGCLPCQNAGLSGFQIEQGSTRGAAGGGGFGKPFEELTGTSIFTLVEGKDCLLQDRRHLLRKRLADVTAECAAHQ